MKRPILVAVIGYVIGIIVGLYFKFSIALFYFVLFPITVIYKLNNKKRRNKKFSFYSISRYLRYLKVFLNKRTLLIIIIFSVLSNTIVLFKNKKFDNYYKMNDNNIEVIAKVDGLLNDNEYKKTYKVNVFRLNNIDVNINLILKTNKKDTFKYGELIKIYGIYNAPNFQKNFGGFDYIKYLKALNIYGIISANDIKEIGNLKTFDLNVVINNLNEKIIYNSKKYLDKDVYPVFLGLILGNTSYIEEDIKTAFQDANMAYILAVSGMHISYIVISINVLLNKFLGKRIIKIFTIIILFMYIFLVGFSSSLIRASIVTIIFLFGNLLHRKADIWTSISISLFVTLIYNPYLITDIGLQLSYIGVIGILILNKTIRSFLNYTLHLNKVKKYKRSNKFINIKIFKFLRSKLSLLKIKEKLIDIVSVTLSVQIFIFPIVLYHFNTFNAYFLIVSLILSIIIGPIVFLGFIYLICLIFNFSIIKYFSYLINLGVKLILFLTNICKIPFSKIYFPTPNVLEILVFYILIIIINVVCNSFISKNKSTSNIRIIWMFNLLKYNFRKYKKKIISIVIIFIIILNFYNFFIPNNLRIHFLDVGQGDCCFIETPNNKTILIDGGGSEVETFNVGKSILLPYILDRGYIKIDYIFISHFDSDHVLGLFKVMEELKVGAVFISKQGENCENYKKFKEIVNNKKIKVFVVNKGDKINIENNLGFDILWPNNNNLIDENILNNNSMVCKLHYNDFSMLFTGDIEEIAERKILQEYNNKSSIFASKVLKVAHHGSKTSSIKEFIKVVNPQIVLIGVGENNKYGHPNKEVINRLDDLNIKIYRTDKMGEISIIVNKECKIRIFKNISK